MSEASPHIRFGTDGWRAAIAEDFTFASVRRLAAGFARYLKADQGGDIQVIVGYDRRFASEKFAAEAAATLASEGISVLLSDRATPTQLSSFAASRAGCMAFVVTASHNPWLDNGVKIKDITGAPAEEPVLRAIEANIPDYVPPAPATSDRIRVVDFTADYETQLRGLVDTRLLAEVPTKLVVDALHGCGAGWIRRLVPESAQFTIDEIRAERNPYFGGVNPEPILPHIQALCDRVVATGADGGLVFDGDADRVGLVTESGRFVNQLQVYGLLYWHLLADRKDVAPAVYTITTTAMVPKLANAFGTEAFETPVGFKYVGPKMQEVGAVIGGEESGGFGFGFHIPERDGLLAGLLLLEMRAQRNKTFDALLADLQASFGPSEYSRIDVHFEREGYADVVRTVLASVGGRIGEAFPADQVERVVTLGDGFKIYLAGASWLMLRFSGTEPVLRIYAEAGSEDQVRVLLDRGRAMASN